MDDDGLESRISSGDFEFIDGLVDELGVDRDLLVCEYVKVLDKDLVYPRTALYNLAVNEYRRGYKVVKRGELENEE